ncbi:MAG: LytTR family DNA-binding domain-containing protein [Oscillospiraceae bacterium]
MSGIKIILEELPEGEEEEIVIRCSSPDEDILNLIRMLKSRRDKLPCLEDGSIVMVEPRSVYYFEAVDDRVFAYCEKSVYEIRRKLYELEQQFENTDFLRVSKSVIINISKIKRLTPEFSGRLEALLDNGEKAVISRQYVPALKKKLGIGGQS